MLTSGAMALAACDAATPADPQDAYDAALACEAVRGELGVLASVVPGWFPARPTDAQREAARGYLDAAQAGSAEATQRLIDAGEALGLDQAAVIDDRRELQDGVEADIRDMRTSNRFASFSAAENYLQELQGQLQDCSR